MAQNMKRGRNQRRRSGPNVNRALDSSGPDVKIRGTAVQIYDKYQALARDAASSGDRIRAESLLQHAEHYYRVMKAMQPPQQQSQQQNNDPSEEPQPNVESDEKSDEDKPKSRGRSRDRAAKTDEAESTESSDSADEAEEEKPRKPRRKRAPRKSASDDAGKDDEKVSEVAAE